MKLRIRRYSDIGARRPSSGVFAGTVEIEAAVGEYSTPSLFGIFHAFRSFEILSINEKGVTISAVSHTERGTKIHEPQLLEKGFTVSFSDSERQTSDDGPSWTATDELYFKIIE
ncbi:MAG: hypothetical protein IKM00_02990 [Clostridia bacterium]|nr:hypothetical protein [Clostridia bacterium]